MWGVVVSQRSWLYELCSHVLYCNLCELEYYCKREKTSSWSSGPGSLPHTVRKVLISDDRSIFCPLKVTIYGIIRKKTPIAITVAGAMCFANRTLIEQNLNIAWMHIPTMLIHRVGRRITICRCEFPIDVFAKTSYDDRSNSFKDDSIWLQQSQEGSVWSARKVSKLKKKRSGRKKN